MCPTASQLKESSFCEPGYSKSCDELALFPCLGLCRKVSRNIWVTVPPGLFHGLPESRVIPGKPVDLQEREANLEIGCELIWEQTES